MDVVRLADERHPESTEGIPKIANAIRFADGSEVAGKIGLKLWKEGGADPSKLSEAQVLEMIPEGDRKRFSGEPRQLVVLVRSAYLAASTFAGLKAQAEGVKHGSGT